ncbi:hypothetical protein PR003_g20704 [Phytophthora rubi]|uniref:RxLR effector protein n=1 Tax=Phytophthora rubi TaxID=129364 RepID=A0A6A3JR15_9STRA|nr:hypothetical protein PR002_g20151 [Phytophthora rubi]KAE8997329.1 hypothetical protein PR001_g19609 [Phytophthora rubi]KAE9308608.1 hypothetical protein PR003_g20704 [Phytophthora rubi]
MKVGALVTTLTLFSTSTYGYSFSDVAKEDGTNVESTGLTTNEETAARRPKSTSSRSLPVCAFHSQTHPGTGKWI